MAVVGTKEYYQELINKASAELTVLQNNMLTIKASYDSWTTFKAQPYVNSVGYQVCAQCCGRKNGCTGADLASVQGAVNAYTTQLKLIDDKQKQIASLTASLATAPTTTAAQAQQEVINQRKNETWIPIIIGVVVIAAIITLIYFFRKR